MKKKVILFNPPLYFSQGKPKVLDVSVPPLGLLYLASYVNQSLDDFRAEVIDIAVENHSLDEIRAIVKKRKPLVLGITSMTPQLQGAVELASWLKRHFPKIKIFLGGPHVSADPDFINRFADLFDYAITGEAEKTFSGSISKLAKGEKISRLQRGEIILDLDTIPFPDKNLVKRGKYSQYESMMFSRGCPYHCYYCSRPSISRKVRCRSADNLVKEIKSIYQDCDGRIDFQDDTFTLDRKKVLDFCRKIEKQGLNLNWRCNTRIDLIDEELLAAMKKAGCELIHFGIEAGNEKIRQEVVKKGRFTNREIEKVIGLCRKHGIKFAGYFIIGHPGEGKRELEQTKEMILESGLDLMGLSIPTPFPGSELYRLAEERGIINEKIIDQFARKELGEGYAGHYPVLISERVSREYVFSLMKEINRRFYLNWRTFWRRFKEDITSVAKLKQDFWDFVSLVLRGISSRKPYVESDENA